MGSGKNWTKEETELLCEIWGSKSIPKIADRLGRSVNAVKLKAQRLGLGPVLAAGDYVTLNELIKAVTGSDSSYSYKMTSWVKNRGLTIHTRRVEKNTFRVVYLEEFWAWAEKNRSFIDFAKFEKGMLGAEPEWVKEQRRADHLRLAAVRCEPWTPAEDARLLALLKETRYGYAELTELLGRTSGAIQRRCVDLGTPYRPVKAALHGRREEWARDKLRALADGIRRGDSYAVIARALGKSDKSVRGRAYYTYFTEDADKIRRMMGEGDWGDGAPEPTIRKAKNHAVYRKEIKGSMTALVSLLTYRKNELGFDPYWQRFMCAKWDPVKGCLAVCTDCDSCVEFERLKPQYCARCGGTFYERKKYDFCANCRQARLTAARRKWARERKTE